MSCNHRTGTCTFGLSAIWWSKARASESNSECCSHRAAAEAMSSTKPSRASPFDRRPMHRAPAICAIWIVAGAFRRPLSRLCELNSRISISRTIQAADVSWTTWRFTMTKYVCPFALNLYARAIFFIGARFFSPQTKPYITEGLGENTVFYGSTKSNQQSFSSVSTREAHFSLRSSQPDAFFSPGTIFADCIASLLWHRE